MTDATAIADRYLEAYGEPDADRRLQLIADVWSTEGRRVVGFLDAVPDARGRRA